MPTSPDTRNYQYGAGALWLKVDDIDDDYRHAGNMPKLTHSSTFTELDHKQSMSGLKSVDDSFVTEVAAELAGDCEEVTPENMQLFVAGVRTENTDGDTEISGLTLTDIKADLKFIPANPKGAQIEFYARVAIRPNGNFNFITEGLNSIPLKFKILQSEGRFGLWVFKNEVTA